MSNEVYVIGCGAAGMSAAIMAAQKGARVTVLEGMKSPGKKLLLTGNGRCLPVPLGYDPFAGEVHAVVLFPFFCQ